VPKKDEGHHANQNFGGFYPRAENRTAERLGGKIRGGGGAGREDSKSQARKSLALDPGPRVSEGVKKSGGKAKGGGGVG